MNNPQTRVLISAEEIQKRVAELGARITADYPAGNLILVGILKGAFIFTADLARAIHRPVRMDFMGISSYGKGTTSSGEVRVTKDLDSSIEGADIIIVEDIVDSGLTLNYLRKNLAARNPASLEVCALLLKEGMQKVEPDLRYVGFRIPDEFVVGYGLDVAERYRNLDDLRVYVGPGSGH